jgi:hypothetical protein
MRLDIFGQFVVRVVAPRGGRAKGRPIALIEEPDRWCAADLLIPGKLGERALERYVAGMFRAFATPGRTVRRLDATLPRRARS